METAPPVTVESISATYIHAARIDESGLRALARRAREQAQFQAIGPEPWCLTKEPPALLPGPIRPPEPGEREDSPDSRYSA